MEHLDRFGLAREPFRNEPQLDFWFETGAAGAARARLLRCLRQRKELSVLCGEVGAGTTTLARRVLDELDPEEYEVALLVVGRGIEASSLRGAIARQLGVADPSESRSDAMRQLYEHLVGMRDDGRRAVVAIDEAQALAGSEALGELVAMLNLEIEDERLVSALLIGSPELERMLAREPALLGRCELRVRVEALGAGEARAYLAHRIDVAGGPPDLLAPEVADAIAERAGGLPRRMNALADNALFEAHLACRARPALADVERAARDLPWAQGAGDTLSGLAPAAPGREPAKPDATPEVLDRHIRASASAALDALDGPDLEADLGPAFDEEAEDLLDLVPPARPAQRSAGAFDLAMREEQELQAEVLASTGPGHTSPGAWSRGRPVSLDDEVLGAPSSSPPLPDEAEIDGLFVDLVEEDPQPRRRR